MPKKGYKMKEIDKEKRRQGMLLAYKKDKTLCKRVAQVGKNNGRYIDGRYSGKKYYCKCGKEIDFRAKHCKKCRAVLEPSFKGKSHSEKSKKEIGKKSKTKFTEEYLIRIRKTYEERGLWIPKDKIKPYLLYCREANWKERMIDYMPKSEIELLKKVGIFSAKNSKGIVRDHKYSRYSGFNNAISPLILRHPANCQLITHSDNLKKANSKHRYRDGDSITLKQLFNKIKVYSKQWSEQEKCLEYIKKYEN